MAYYYTLYLVTNYPFTLVSDHHLRHFDNYFLQMEHKQPELCFLWWQVS